VRICLISFLALVTISLSAQITAPGSSAVRSTNYISGGPNHQIFIYCSASGSTPELNAVSPGGTGPFTFDWFAWNSGDSDFTTPVKSDVSVLSSNTGAISPGGYRVRITDGFGYDISLIAWVHFDTPLSEISLQQALCDQVTLRGRAFVDTFYYSDIVTGQQLILPNGVAHLYSSDPVSLIANPTLHTYNLGDYGLKILNTPPLVDVTYQLEVTDSFGCISESSFFYESFHVNAEFSVDPDMGEAPLEVFITDNSVRALNYIWRFGDDTISNSSDPISHTYYKPGTYTIRLTIESDRGCIDSVNYETITVEPSSINIPNVFTPDDDGINDFFFVDSKSLRYIYVQLFSEAGKRVYTFEGRGEALSEWQGWDGKIGPGKAAPGIYFYFIRAAGWDNTVYDGEEYRGFFYLYR
jgi:hypothetical protein